MLQMVSEMECCRNRWWNTARAYMGSLLTRSNPITADTDESIKLYAKVGHATNVIRSGVLQKQVVKHGQGLHVVSLLTSANPNICLPFNAIETDFLNTRDPLASN